MTRLYGRAERGQRVYDSAPGGNWETTTMIAAIGSNGPQAPFVFNGPIDAQVFRVYVERVLVPTLKGGDIVVLDNLSTHKDRYARDLILAAGAVIWDLPPYSPDLNPIEQAFSKLKHFLRKARERTVDDTTSRIGSILSLFKPEECSNYFRNAGYGSV